MIIYYETRNKSLQVFINICDIFCYKMYYIRIFTTVKYLKRIIRIFANIRDNVQSRLCTVDSNDTIFICPQYLAAMLIFATSCLPTREQLLKRICTCTIFVSNDIKYHF
jgi:hypothetical protein